MVFDIVIIGAGLAGCAAAIMLAEAGHHVALLERHTYPRHKMCGEFLSPETIPIFERLGVWQTIQAAQPARLLSTRITAPNGQRLDIPLPAPSLGLSRYRLDHLLLERARTVGAIVYEGCPVSEVRGSLEEGFAVESRAETIQARVVLGAWGKRSTLDRTLARPFFTQRAAFIALKVHVRGPEPEERVELHGFPGGYCGVNHIEQGVVNVCLLATLEAWARAGKKVDPFWAMIQQQNPMLAAQLAGAEKLSKDIVISNISFAHKGPIEQDILMLGDSAKLISPLTGNGQAMALQAALLAVPLVDRFLRRQSTPSTLRKAYAKAWSHQFRERLIMGRFLQPLFLQPRALSLGLRLASACPPLARWLVKGTRERQ